MKKRLLIICLLLVSGCALVPTRRDMRKDYDGKFSIIVEKNYQLIYRKWMNEIHNSPDVVWIGDRRIINNIIHNDTKTAYIRICRVNAIGGEYLQSLIDIKFLEEKKTIITVYYCNIGWDAKGSRKAYIDSCIDFITKDICKAFTVVNE